MGTGQETGLAPGAQTEGEALPYRFRWRRTRYGDLDEALAGRFGQPCRAFARGRNGSLGLEFADGFRVVTMRFAVARAHAGSGTA